MNRRRGGRGPAGAGPITPISTPRSPFPKRYQVKQGTVSRDSQNRRRCYTERPHPGDRQRGGLPLHIITNGHELYPALAQRLTSPEALRTLLSVGPTETAHFQTWHDKAGNTPPLTDLTTVSLVCPTLNSPPFGGDELQTNPIMPEPLPFLSRKFPVARILWSSWRPGAGCR